MPVVFWYKLKNPQTGKMEEAPNKATEAAIARLGGEKIWGSAEEVEDDQVQEDGVYVSPFGP